MVARERAHAIAAPSRTRVRSVVMRRPVAAAVPPEGEAETSRNRALHFVRGSGRTSGGGQVSARHSGTWAATQARPCVVSTPSASRPLNTTKFKVSRKMRINSARGSSP